ncbi:jasmonate-induced oxygenase 2-like isoform X2 [Daucus carota subsp. sativus]|uniref:jasmonate-induced oxygenase 2-like isoform X2 n=1 Tax=Daucus carota subsp. sativus TaxID=79200 RepID=UPI0030836C84
MSETLESTVFKPVQELAVDCNTPPERYIYTCSNEAIGVNPPVLDIPVIDLNSLQSSSPSADRELEKLRASVTSCGCFQLIGHGMTSSFLDQVSSIGRDFFALPVKEKLKCLRTAENTQGKLLQEYTEKINLLTEAVLKVLSRSLNLKESCFLDQYGENAYMVARFNYYPPSPRPDLTLGVKPHADGSAMTFLIQDKQVEGLQVLKDDQWFNVPNVPDALLVNIGDQVEIMSNGIYKSPVHRVVTNSERERITVAMFCSPNSSRYIEPAEELISKRRPRLYKKVNNYFDMCFEGYQHGKPAIEAAKM